MSLSDRIASLGGVGAVARKTKISRATLYKAFARERKTGSHNMDTAKMVKIAAAFGRTVEWVREGDGTDKGKQPDTLGNARMVAQLVVEEYALTERDAWLLLYDLPGDAATMKSLFAATIAKLRALGIPRREPSQAPPTERRNRSEQKGK